MENRDQSEFNLAISFLNRLNMYFYMANEAAVSLDAYNWFHALIVIRRELSDDMKEGELKEANKYKEDINNMLLRNKRRRNATGQNEIPKEIYDRLDQFEIFLRMIVKNAGYKTKYKDDPSFAMTGGQ